MKGGKMKYTFNKSDIAIIGEMVTLLSKKYEPGSCGDVVIENVNKNPKIKTKVNWDSVESFIRRLQKYERYERKEEK
jgi:hypothetical protein